MTDPDWPGWEWKDHPLWGLTGKCGSVSAEIDEELCTMRIFTCEAGSSFFRFARDVDLPTVQQLKWYAAGFAIGRGR